MSYRISELSVTLTKTPGKTHHWDSTCRYKLTEADGRIYQVIRPLFSNIKEGRGVGRNYLTSNNSSGGIAKFTGLAQQWEAQDHRIGIARMYKAGTKRLIKGPTKTPIAHTPVAIPLQSVHAELRLANQNNAQLQQSLNTLNSQVGGLSTICEQLRTQIAEKNQLIDQLRVDLNANQAQIQQLTQQIEVLNTSLLQILTLL